MRGTKSKKPSIRGFRNTNTCALAQPLFYKRSIEINILKKVAKMLYEI